ncbi:MAG TPA: helix-turn-helix domain-containing protein [Nocardioides sp.]|nr:helix-turn-helix domain-containing protein [Nocardioides sp.]
MNVTSGPPGGGSASGRPIMALLDLLGRRGTLRILWELRGGGLTFRALQAAADTNPGVLNSRVKELRQAGIVTRGDGGYELTASGRALVKKLVSLNRWADEWAQDAHGDQGRT